MTDPDDRAEAIIEFAVWQGTGLSHGEAHVVARSVLAALRDAGRVVVAAGECNLIQS